LPFFIEFLQVSGQFDPWVESCPLVLSSPNAPSRRDVLGTAVLSPVRAPALRPHQCAAG